MASDTSAVTQSGQNEQDGDVTTRAEAQWVVITNNNISHVTIVIKNVTLKWGKFHENGMSIFMHFTMLLNYTFT
jgi:Aegerolysin